MPFIIRYKIPAIDFRGNSITSIGGHNTKHFLLVLAHVIVNPRIKPTSDILTLFRKCQQLISAVNIKATNQSFQPIGHHLNSCIIISNHGRPVRNCVIVFLLKLTLDFKSVHAISTPRILRFAIKINLIRLSFQFSKGLNYIIIIAPNFLIRRRTQIIIIVVKIKLSLYHGVVGIRNSCNGIGPTKFSFPHL